MYDSEKKKVKKVKFSVYAGTTLLLFLFDELVCRTIFLTVANISRLHPLPESFQSAVSPPSGGLIFSSRKVLLASSPCATVQFDQLFDLIYS